MGIAQFLVQFIWAAKFWNRWKFVCTEFTVDECDGRHAWTQNDFNVIGEIQLWIWTENKRHEKWAKRKMASVLSFDHWVLALPELIHLLNALQQHMWSGTMHANVEYVTPHRQLHALNYRQLSPSAQSYSVWSMTTVSSSFPIRSDKSCLSCTVQRLHDRCNAHYWIEMEEKQSVSERNHKSTARIRISQHLHSIGQHNQFGGVVEHHAHSLIAKLIAKAIFIGIIDPFGHPK